MDMKAERWKPEVRRILALAWPVMLTSLNWTLMHLADVAIVGRIGTDQLGVLAAGRSVTFITIVVGIAAMSGILVYTARADGAGKESETGAIWRQGMLLGALIGVSLGALLLLGADGLMRAIGVAPELARGGASVVRAMALAYPAQFLSIASAFFLEGISRPRRVMVINLATLPINAVLAWAWAGGHWGLPAWGAVGAVLATAVASTLGMVAMIVSIWRIDDAVARNIRRIGWSDWRLAARGTWPLLRFGLVPGLAAGFEVAGFSWLIILSTQLGTVAAAAFQTMLSLHNFGFALSLGFGSAAGVRAGNAMGEGVPLAATSRGMLAAIMAAAVTGSFGLLAYLAPHALIATFSNDPAVIGLAVTMLFTLAPFMVFDALQVVLVNVLRAMGDQVVAGINTVIGFFVVTGVGGWWMVRTGMGPMALIWAAAGGMLAVALLQSARFWQLRHRLSRQSASLPTGCLAVD
jgi:MATE family multidrug resistance protein